MAGCKWQIPTFDKAGAMREIALNAANCTSCMICVRECPTWCIDLTFNQTQEDRGTRRPVTVNVLETFQIDYGLCMFCGICIDTCPHDALHWAENAENSLNQDAIGNGKRENLVYPFERLESAWDRRI